MSKAYLMIESTLYKVDGATGIVGCCYGGIRGSR